MQTLPVFSVGCVEGNFPVYVYVAGASKEVAESYVRQHRPRLDIVNTQATEERADVTGPKIVGLKEA